MADVTYTVKWGDTLSEIAQTYLSTLGVSTISEGVVKLVQLNNIKDPDFIVVGQKLKITGTADTVKKNTTNKVRIDTFGLQSDTDRTVYAMWTFQKDNLEEYEVDWRYYTANKKWFQASDTNARVKANQCTYTAPQNALKVKVRIKPHSKTYTKKGKEVKYWNGGWCSYKTYSFSSNPPKEPPVPTVTIDNYTLTARVDNLDVNGTDIQFNVVKNDTKSFKTVTVDITKASASFTCTVDAGAEYKVRCRAHRDGLYSDWTDYSSPVATIPSAPDGITVCRANSKTSVYLEWAEVKSAKTYELQYATKLEYFNGSDAVSSTSGIETTKYEKTGLETGEEYFFRVRAVNDKGQSPWSGIKSVVIGSDPEAPTTWSSTTTVITGEPLTLYWVHNAKDGSSQTFAELEITVGEEVKTYTIENTRDEDEKDKTSYYIVDTSEYIEGTKLLWRVRTAGVTKVYGNWSIQRTIDVYAPVTLELNLLDANGENTDTLESFPCRITALAGPRTQAPIGYHIAIISKTYYETVDVVGNVKIVNEGETVYSKYFDIKDALDLELSAGDVDLENGADYSIVGTVSMDSGLSTEESLDFTVSWEDQEYEPNATVIIDDETFTAAIKPFCEDENGDPIPDITLSVYRREFDGTFTELATGIENIVEIENDFVAEVDLEFTANTPIEYDSVALEFNQPYNVYWNGTKYVVVSGRNGLAYIGNPSIDSTGMFNGGSDTGHPFFIYYKNGKLIIQNRDHIAETVTLRISVDYEVSNTFVVDPHPALDYARYRVVAIAKSTGAVSYYDLPGEPVGGDAVIIQWDEAWSAFDANDDDNPEEPNWSGSMLKLPYNVDVSDSNSKDVELVEYIGREHPVAYYGTQIGSTANWNMVIEKDDEETLYGLRRLARWMGDVYVREPSGTGYWANISVNISQKHRDLTIPVTLSITRVEGGI